MIMVQEIRSKARLQDYDLTSFSDEEINILDRIKMLMKHKGKLVKHFKGKIYQIIDIAEHTESGEELVIYKAMYGDCNMYARPIDMFISKVDKEKYPEVEQEYRLEFIEIQ